MDRMKYLKLTNGKVACSKRNGILVFLFLVSVYSAAGQGVIFTERTGDDNPLNSAEVGSGTTSITVDIDNDGDFDFFVGAIDGGIKYYKNIGTVEAPNEFEEQIGSDNPFDGVDVGSNATVVFVDIDNNTTLDAFVGSTNQVFYFKNTGTITAPVFEAQNGVDNPLSSVVYSGNRVFSISFADTDFDADVDVFVGWVDYDVENSSGIDYYRNTGTKFAPVFEQQLGDGNPFNDFKQIVSNSDICRFGRRYRYRRIYWNRRRHLFVF